MILVFSFIDMGYDRLVWQANFNQIQSIYAMETFLLILPKCANESLLKNIYSTTLLWLLLETSLHEWGICFRGNMVSTMQGLSEI